MRYTVEEEVAFLASIRDDPETVGVYADWLEECDLGENAQFIRLCLAYKRVQNTDPALSQERDTLWEEIRSHQGNLIHWTGRQMGAVCAGYKVPLLKGLLVTNYEKYYPLGLVTEVDTYPAYWLSTKDNTAKALIKSYPIHCLKFLGSPNAHHNLYARSDIDEFLPLLVRISGGLDINSWARLYVFLGDKLEHSEVTRDRASVYFVPANYQERLLGPEAVSFSVEERSAQWYPRRLQPGRGPLCQFSRKAPGVVVAITDRKDVFYTVGCFNCGGSSLPVVESVATSGTVCRNCSQRVHLTLSLIT